jgi:hypothetical protein
LTDAAAGGAARCAPSDRRRSPRQLLAHGGDTREPIYRVRREGVPIGAFAPLRGEDYAPIAMTPPRDAVAQSIAHLDRLRAPDRATNGPLWDESRSMSANRRAVIAGVNAFVAGMRQVDDPQAPARVLAAAARSRSGRASRRPARSAHSGAEQLAPMGIGLPAGARTPHLGCQ